MLNSKYIRAIGKNALVAYFFNLNQISFRIFFVIRATSNQSKQKHMLRIRNILLFTSLNADDMLNIQKKFQCFSVKFNIYYIIAYNHQMVLSKQYCT